MDWLTYKVLCDRPDYWSRWMLDQLEDLLEQLQENQLLADLRANSAAQPLPMPADHRGPAMTRMHQVSLQPQQRLRILRAINAADQQGMRTAATRKRGLAGFVEAWREYTEYQA